MDKVELFIRDRALLYLKKNKDYGESFNKSLDKYGEVAFLVRAEDKINRFEVLYKRRAEVEDEKIEDTVMDLFNYIVMYDMYVERVDKLKDFIDAYNHFMSEGYMYLADVLDTTLNLDRVIVNLIIAEIKEYIEKLE